MESITELKRIIEAKNELIEAQAATIRQLEEYMLQHLTLVKVGQDIQLAELDRDTKVRSAALQQAKDRLNDPVTQEEIDEVLESCKPPPIVWKDIPVPTSDLTRKELDALLERLRRR